MWEIEENEFYFGHVEFAQLVGALKNDCPVQKQMKMPGAQKEELSQRFKFWWSVSIQLVVQAMEVHKTNQRLCSKRKGREWNSGDSSISVIGRVGTERRATGKKGDGITEAK